MPDTHTLTLTIAVDGRAFWPEPEFADPDGDSRDAARAVTRVIAAAIAGADHSPVFRAIADTDGDQPLYDRFGSPCGSVAFRGYATPPADPIAIHDALVAIYDALALAYAGESIAGMELLAERFPAIAATVPTHPAAMADDVTYARAMRIVGDDMRMTHPELSDIAAVTLAVDTVGLTDIDGTDESAEAWRYVLRMGGHQG